MTEMHLEKEIKLVALDMDGTLLNKEHEISARNREAIRMTQEMGIHVVLSTGRSLKTCGEYADSLNLSSFLVTVNGSEIWDHKGNLVEQNLLHTDLVQLMWDLRKEHNTNFWAISADNVWRGEFPEDLTKHKWLKFGFDVDDDDTRKTIYEILANNGQLEISNSSEKNLEVNAVGINKANALKKVCSHVGISMENVLAMGDSLNDLSMIKESGIGVAMENAQDAVKKAANWITDTNDNDGVAKAIEKFIMNK